jgi:predicted  nucleic acid-binding Zn ribbon protein
LYIQELILENKTNIDDENLVDEFLFLLSCFRKSGQLQSDNEASYIVDNSIKCNIATLEKNSLEKKHNTEWVNKQLDKIEKLCSSKLQIKTLGKTFKNYTGVCRCKKHDFLILFTHFLNNAGPVDCGNCFKPIPLYKIIELNQGIRQEILCWEQDYQSCDKLQIHCTVGEKWATKQMSDSKSQLSKEGIEICRKIQDLTDIPTYYYLYNYRNIKIEKDKKRPCPSCNGKWILEKKLNTLYDFKCDNCNLISSITSNGY